MKPESPSSSETNDKFDEEFDNIMADDEAIIRKIIADDKTKMWQMPVFAIGCACISFILIAMIVCLGRKCEGEKTIEQHPDQQQNGLLNEVITIRS